MVFPGEGMVVIDVGVEGKGGIVVLVLVEGGRGPVVVEPLLIEFRNLVKLVILLLLMPLLAEIGPEVIGNLAVHRQAGNQGAHVPGG